MRLLGVSSHARRKDASGVLNVHVHDITSDNRYIVRKSQMSATLDLLQELIRCQSITPVDAGCQQIIAQRLKK